MNLTVYTSTEWESVAEDVHLSVFSEIRPKELNRIDGALICWDDVTPLGYMTFREMDKNSVYLGYGGAFQKSFKVLSAYKMMLEFLKMKYVRASTLIENKNTAMLKLAMSQGFLVTGLKCFDGQILLENSIDWSLNERN